MQSMNLCVIFRRGKCPIYQIGLSKHSTHTTVPFFLKEGQNSVPREYNIPYPKKMVTLPVLPCHGSGIYNMKHFKKKYMNLQT